MIDPSDFKVAAPIKPFGFVMRRDPFQANFSALGS